MRVSSFSRGSVIAIGAFAAIFLATMFKVGSSLSEGRQQNAGYQEIKSLSTVDFYRTIANYLDSGDASQLNKAEAELAQIVKRSNEINIGTLGQQIDVKAQTLKTDIETKYRAMGKLSGEPLALLRNGEQDMVFNTHKLATYASESEQLGDAAKVKYLMVTDGMAKSLDYLINSREKAFLQDNVDQASIELALIQVKNQLDLITNLPLLGITEKSEEDEDELMLDEDEGEDLSEEAVLELSSLVNRYSAELQNTIALQQQRKQGLTLLIKQVEELENIILDGEKSLLTEQEAVNQQLLIVVIVLLVFLVMFLVANYWLTRSVVLQPLRKLRDGFVTLVNEGRVDQIKGIPEKTELGEISVCFNQMVTKLQEDDQQKAKQLLLVSSALDSMQAQANRIYQTSNSTVSHVGTARQIMELLSSATETVNGLSQQVVENAQATQQAMFDSQEKVSQVIVASKSTTDAAEAGKNSINTLGQSVESVGTIVDVISAIADQTNLLALNAAIEAARAGEHGRGFSVVADEVRQLASKTQDSLGQISNRLEQLQLASRTLEKSIEEIAVASNQQQTIATLLKENADTVVEQAERSADVAQDTLSHVTQQRGHYSNFELAMNDVSQQVNQSQDIANNISDDVNLQVADISKTLSLVS